MTIYSYVSRTVEQGGWTGVCRADATLRRAIPGLQSVTLLPVLKPEDIVITDNHLSLDVPDETKTIVVHRGCAATHYERGCAATHYERDPAWRTVQSAWMVKAQKIMFECPNRTYIAPSSWVANEFRRHLHCLDHDPKIIPNWVDPIDPLPKTGKPKVIGDWRDFNKGRGIWNKLAERYPQWEFQPLQFRDNEGRRKQYGEASLYLCLSLSEGGAHSVCDAEAAELPIVTTNIGNYLEFDDCEVIRWQERENINLLAEAIDRKLRAGRSKPSFYAEYSFERWVEDWQRVIR
jgi:hypothetical protein